MPSAARVPSAESPSAETIPALDRLADLLRGRRVVALSGAGISTESGIPDYRGPGTRRRAKSPIQYNDFVGAAATQRRYWARAFVGWGRMAAARPNAGHRALARMERGGLLQGVITQNVDGLHQAAGARRVVELHGALAEVACLGCGALTAREAVQKRIAAENADWAARRDAAPRPDGDAALPDAAIGGFRAPACLGCGGALKPNVVFFGESVPKARVEAAWALFEEAEVLLIVGSSLAVYSGYRFALRAAKEGKPFALVNLGPTRADDRAAVRVTARLGDALPRLAHALLGG